MTRAEGSKRAAQLNEQIKVRMRVLLKNDRLYEWDKLYIKSVKLDRLERALRK